MPVPKTLSGYADEAELVNELLPSGGVFIWNAPQAAQHLLLRLNTYLKLMRDSGDSQFTDLRVECLEKDSKTFRLYLSTSSIKILERYNEVN